MTDKVIEFPKHKVVRDVPEEHMIARQAKADQKLADAIVDDLTGMMITELDNCMVEVENKQFSKDFVLVADALKACVYRSFGIDHHLHDFVDNNVKLIEGADGMTKEEIKEKIESVMAELLNAKEKLDTEEEE
jgi:hypothetical protein